MAPKKRSSGGLKGFFINAGRSFFTGGLFVRDKSHWLAEKMCKIGYVIATTTVVTFMPLVFEIAREGQMIESEKTQVKQLRNDGYSDRQLQEMGFCEASILRAPPVALKK